MLNAIIVDDKITNTETLDILLQKYCPAVQVIAAATDIEEAYQLILQHRPDLVFLDIELNNATGFDLLRKFKEVSFETIFTTAYSEYAIQAFREQAVDYLLKPIHIPFLQEAVIKAEKQIGLKRNKVSAATPKPATNKISLPSQDGYQFIDIREIIRCEASGSYSVFYLTGNRKIVVSMRLKLCESKLPAHSFFRVHNSHIVNIQYVIKYQRGKTGAVILSDGTEIEVASSRKEAFLEVMNQHT